MSTNGISKTLFNKDNINKDIIKDYNTRIRDGRTSQQAFSQASKGANQATIDLMASANGAAVSQGALDAALQKSAVAAKASKVAMGGLAIAGTMLAGIAVSWAIGKIFEGIDSIAHHAENAKKASEEAKKAIDDINSSLREQSDIVSNQGSKYSELAQGVNQLTNANISLDNEDYQEFLSLSNELAELFPSLKIRTDENGNAILNLNGNITTINSTLDEYLEKAKLASQIESIKNFTGEGDKNDYFEGAKNQADKYRQEISKYDESSMPISNMQDFLTDKTRIDYNDASKMQDLGTLLHNELDQSDVSDTDYTTIEQLIDNIQYSENSNDAKDASEKLQSILSYYIEKYKDQSTVATANLEAQNAEISSTGQPVLERSALFLNKDTPQETKDAMTNALSMVDWSSVNGIKNGEQAADYIRNAFSTEISKLDKDEQDTMSSFFNAPSDIDLSEYTALYKRVKSIFSENQIDIPLEFSMEHPLAIKKTLQDQKNDLGATDSSIITSYLSQNSINDANEIDLWNQRTEGAKSAAEAVELYEQKTKEANESLLNSDSEYNADTNKNNFKSDVSYLKNAYSEKEQNEFVGSDTISDMEDSFGGLGSSWENYKQILGSSSSSLEDCKKAQNELAMAYVQSEDFLNGLTDATGNCTDANKDYYVSLLESLGVENAEAVVTDSIAKQKINLALANFDFANSSPEQIAALQAEINQLIGNDQALETYAFKKAMANNGALDTTASVTNLITLAQQCATTGKALEELQKLQSLRQEYDAISLAAPYVGKSEDLKNKQGEIEAQEVKTQTAANKIKIPSTTDSSGSSTPPPSPPKNTPKSETTTTIDFIDRKLDKLATKTKDTIDFINNYIAQSTKNKRYKSLLNDLDKEINAAEKGAKYYKTKADAVELSDDLKKKIRNGAISVSTLKGKTAERANTYMDNYDKYVEAKQTIKEKKSEKRAKSREALDSRIEFRGNKLSKLEASSERTQSNIDIAESRGIKGSANQYNSLSKNADKQKKNLAAQNDILKDYLSDNKIKKNSAEWFDINTQINANKDSMEDLTKSQIEWNNAIEEMRFDKFEYLSKVLDTVKSKFDAMVSLHEAQGLEMSDAEIFENIDINNKRIQQNTSEKDTSWANIWDNATSTDPANGWGWGLNSNEFTVFKDAITQLRNGDISEDEFKQQTSRIFKLKDIDYDADIFNNSELTSYLDTIDASEIDTINALKENEELINGYQEKKIKGAEDYIEKLKEANNTRSKAIELEKMQQKLQNAMQNKTSLVYREGYGFSYEADQDAVSDAQSELDSYKFDEFIDKMQDFVDALKEININLYNEDESLKYTPEQAKALIDQQTLDTAKQFGFSDAKYVENEKKGYDFVPTLSKTSDSSPVVASTSSNNLINSRLASEFSPDFASKKIDAYSNFVNSQKTSTSTISIANVNLPNINDSSTALDIVNEFSTLETYALQKMNGNK